MSSWKVQLTRPLSAIADLPKIGPDKLVELGSFAHLAEVGSHTGHLVVKRLAVVFDFGRADVTAGRQNVGVLTDFVERGRFAEASYIRIRPQRALLFQDFVYAVAGRVALARQAW